MIVVLGVSLAMAFAGGTVFARGFGGRRLPRAAGSAGVASAAAASAAAASGGFGGFGGGGFRGGGGYGGMRVVRRDVVVQLAPAVRAGGGDELRVAAGPPRGWAGAGSTTARVGFLRPRRGAGPSTTARRASAGEGPAASRRGVARTAARGTTAGGRSYADVGRAGGVVGPGGERRGGRSERRGRLRAARDRRRPRIAAPVRAVVGASARGRAPAARVHVAAGRTATRATGPTGTTPTAGYHSGLGPRLLERPQRRGLGLAQPVLGRRWGLGLGMGLGWGLSSWGFGSSLYGMGYMPYANPYYVAARSAVSRSWPRPTTTRSRSTPSAAPADQAVADPAMALFDAGRDVVPAGELRPRPCSRPTTPWRSSPTTRPCTSSGPLPVRAGAVRRGRRDPLRRALGRPRLGLDDAHRPLSRRRRLHRPAPRPGGLLQGQHRLGLGPLRAGLPLPDPGPHRRGGRHPQAGGRAQAQRHPLGEAAHASSTRQGQQPAAGRGPRPGPGRHDPAARARRSPGPGRPSRPPTRRSP